MTSYTTTIEFTATPNGRVAMHITDYNRRTGATTVASVTDGITLSSNGLNLLVGNITLMDAEVGACLTVQRGNTATIRLTDCSLYDAFEVNSIEENYMEKVVLEGATIGRGVSIVPHLTVYGTLDADYVAVKGAVVGANTVLRGGAHLHDCMVAQNCDISAYIGPNNEVMEGNTVDTDVPDADEPLLCDPTFINNILGVDL